MNSHQEQSLYQQIKSFFRDEDEGMDVVDDDDHSPVGHIYPDDELEKVVKELLKNSQLVNAEDITVTAHNADITLSGTVKSDEEKNTAGSIVQFIHGVGLIHNDLIVKLNEGILPTDIGRNP